jgi:hypothetical protein
MIIITIRICIVTCNAISLLVTNQQFACKLEKDKNRTLTKLYQWFAMSNTLILGKNDSKIPYFLSISLELWFKLWNLGRATF